MVTRPYKEMDNFLGRLVLRLGDLAVEVGVRSGVRKGVEFCGVPEGEGPM